MTVPAVRSRLLNSFGREDVGSSARLEALRAFPDVMSGHWIFGLGWGRREYFDPATTFDVNFVANSPLLTVYRGGIVVGIAFVAVLVTGCVLSAYTMRGQDWRYGLVGAAFISFSVVAAQVDYPVVTIPAITTVFSILLAFTVHAYRQSRPINGSSDHDNQEAHDKAGEGPSEHLQH